MVFTSAEATRELKLKGVDIDSEDVAKIIRHIEEMNNNTGEFAIEKRGGEGQPPLWNNAEELIKRVNLYNEYIYLANKPFTMSGVAYFLGCSRQTIINYSKKDEFIDVIKKIRALCEMENEEDLIVGKSPIGNIFRLKNNHNWRDKYEHETNVNVKIDKTLSLQEAEHEQARLSALEGEVEEV